MKAGLKSLLIPLLSAGFIPLSALELNVNQSFTSREKPVVSVYTSPGKKVFFRLYRIKDPLKFLNAQKNPHTVKFEPERTASGGLAMLRGFTENLKWSLHSAARRYIRPEYRVRLRENLNLKPYRYPYKDRFPGHNLYKPLSHPLVEEFSRKMSSKWGRKNIGLPAAKPGFYLVEASQGRRIAFAPLIISDIAMVVKEGMSSRLVYAVNILNNKPVRSAEVQILENRHNTENRRIEKTVHLRNGVYFEADAGDNLKKRYLYLLKAGDHYALSDIGLYNRKKSAYRSSVFTDRPVYRQGHKVNFKGIIYKSDDGELNALNGSYRVTVTAPGKKKMFNRRLPLNNGSFSAAINLPDNAPLGYYRIKIDLNGHSEYGSFFVEQYKKPSFKVSVSGARKIFMQGSDLKFHVQSNYYSGEPLRQARVTYSIERRPVSYPWWYGYRYSWYYSHNYYGGYWQHVKSGRAVTDSEGHLVINYNPDQKKKKKKKDEADYEYRVTARVTGADRDTITGRGIAKLVRSEVSLRLSQKRWYYLTGKDIDLSVHAERWDNNRPLSAQKVRLELLRRRYDYKQKKTIETVVETMTGRTGENGSYTFNFQTDKHGSYLARVSTTDKKGRKTVTEKSFYVYTPWGGASSVSENSIDITPDKTEYSFGDTAELKIQGPESGGAVLITAEADEVLRYWLVDSEKGIVNHRVELNRMMSPNVYISAHSFGFKESPVLYAGKREIIVPPADKFLQVSVEADRKRFSPGEKGRFMIRTLDMKGRPVQAEYALSVVDEAIYAIRGDSRDLAKELYPRRVYRINTSDSLNFRFYGYSKEYSLYSELRNHRDRILADFKDKKEDNVRIRKNFKDTARWIATGRTDSNGRDMIEITFPDNLTAWRFTAHAHTADGMVGTTRNSVKVAKDFSLRMAMPRFLRENDRAEFGLLVQNQHRRSVTAALNLDIKGLELTQGLPSTLTLKPRSEKRVDFWVKAADYPAGGKATLTAKAVVRDFDSDGIQKEIQVHPYGIVKTVSESISLRHSTGSFSIKLPDDAREKPHSLQISYTSGVIPAVTETLPYLIRYPYGCVEQTLSTFVPLQQAKKISEKLNINLPVDESTVTEYTDKGLNRLYGYQHKDGGWGWWQNDETNPYMTAYTVDGLLDAKAAGVKVRKYVLKRGQSRLQKFLNEETDNDSYFNTEETRIYQSYVYSRYAEPDQNIIRLWQRYLQSENKNPYMLALIAAGSKNWRSASTERQAVRDLLNSAEKQGSTVHFSSGKRSYRWYHDSEETTARALMVLMNDTRGRKIAPEIITWMLRSKQNRRWRSTRTSAIMIRALAEYAALTSERTGPARVKITAGQKTETFRFDPESYTFEDMSFQFSPDSREVTVETERSNRGYFMVKADWQYYTADALSRGSDVFSIERKYFKLIRSSERGEYIRAATPASSFKTGDYVLALTELNAGERASYVLLENPLPAGLEVPRRNENIRVKDNAFRYYNRPSGTDIFDERVAMSRTYLYKNKWHAGTVLKAVTPGRYQVMPAAGMYMYYPETAAYSGNDLIQVNE